MTEMTRSHVKRETAQARAYSQAVITTGGRTIWLAGQVAIEDGAGRSLAGDFDGQVREMFARLGRTLEEAGAKLSDMVTMTVFITDAARRPLHAAAQGDLRRRFPGQRADHGRRPGPAGNTGRGAGRRGLPPEAPRSETALDGYATTCRNRGIQGVPRQGAERPLDRAETLRT